MPITATQLLTGIGGIVALSYAYQILNFIWKYFIRPSNLSKYLHGSEPYAVITGASDGIGKETAKELYRKGFNIIIHGRNEVKVRKVVEEILALPGPSRDVRYFIAPADSAEVDFERIARQYEDLNITLLVNNVGGGRERPDRIDSKNHTDEDLLGDIRLNMLFPFYLTRHFLPILRKHKGPALVAFVGSISAEISIPRLSTYAPCKAFLAQLTRCLNADERWWTPTQISFIHLRVGAVNSNSFREPSTLFVPTAERFSKWVVRALGSGEATFLPYPPHAIQMVGAKFASEGMMEAHAAETMKKQFERNGKKTE
ncbi:VLCFA Elongation and Steroid Dehydrogenase [Abortiporus biennis]